jgi:hypothetical protein
MTFTKKLDNFIFKAPSKRQYKKYDVYDLNNNYITSFGDNRYEQFKDRIGFYSNKDHNDNKRRNLYRLRHSKDNLTNTKSAGYFSFYYLW